MNEAIEKLSNRLNFLREKFEETSSRQDMINIPQEIDKAQREIEGQIKKFDEALDALEKTKA